MGSVVGAPQDREAVGEIVADHLPKFGRVLSEAWDAYATACRQAPEQMAFASASSRGMLVSDFSREPAQRIFGSVAEASVDERYGRPWISLGGGAVQIRFRKLNSDLSLCRSDSDRSISLAYHLGDPALPGIEPFTVLTAGYVLDAADQEIEQLALVCHIGEKDVYYSFPIPLAVTASTDAANGHPVLTPTGGDSDRRPTQLSLAPLSPPIIRSAQTAAAKRLAAGHADASMPADSALRHTIHQRGSDA